MKKRLLCSLLVLVIISQPVFASDLPSGENIRIAIIDTGISTLAISSEQVEQGYNYMSESMDTEDEIGHGTAIAGLIVGSVAANVPGTAPNAKLVPLVYQIKDENGKIQKADQEAVARAIRDAIDVYGCRVINLSVGTTMESMLLREAVEYAEEKNALIISSVGNRNVENPDCLYYPAAYPTVIGVGSVSKKEQVSKFSQRNESVMLVANGEKIWTASREGRPLLTNGTSFATAFVSGAVAVLLSAYPKLTAAKVRQILCESAKDIQEVGYDTDSGWGILQLEEALAKAVNEGKRQIELCKGPGCHRKNNQERCDLIR